jgi:2'-5' RNA ligase
MVATVSAKSSIRDTGERYFYVYLTKNNAVSEQFRHTPQHITFIPPFFAAKQDVIKIAEDTAKNFKSFNVRLGRHTAFGSKKDIPVILIRPTKALNDIHLALISGLKVKKIDIYSIYKGQFINNEFIPHITLKDFHPKLDATKPLTIDHIAVMYKYKNIKTIIAKFMFRGWNEAAAG